MSRIVKCGLIQTKNEIVSPNGGTDAKTMEKIKKAMLDKHVEYIKKAGEQNVQILCLQEIFNGPYFCAEQQNCWFPRRTEPVFPPRSEPPLSMVF